jgi:hypothetical protein
MKLLPRPQFKKHQATIEVVAMSQLDLLLLFQITCPLILKIAFQKSCLMQVIGSNLFR